MGNGSNEKVAIPNSNRSEVLEIWRTLWVEADQMLGPPDEGGGIFNGDLNCGGAMNSDCDDVRANPEEPVITTLTTLLDAAFVKVRLLYPGFDQAASIPFVHNLASVVNTARDVLSSNEFWTVHLIGAYEWLVTHDNDGNNGSNNEAWIAGWSAHDGTDDPSNFVFFETIRDLWAEPELPEMISVELGKDRISAHEALHRFFGWHDTDLAADQGIMDPQKLMKEPNVWLTSRQVRVIQAKDRPR